MSAIEELFNDLNAGVYAQQVEQALKETAAGCVQHGRAGEVVLTFKLKQIGQSSQVAMTHGLKFTAPTARGKRSEESASETPLHVGKGGYLSLFPDQEQRSIPYEKGRG